MFKITDQSAEKGHLVSQTLSSHYNVLLFGVLIVSDYDIINGAKLCFQLLQRDKTAVAALARDVKARCAKVIETLRVREKGDITKSIGLLPGIISATVECYSGNGSFCPSDSLVCNGVGSEGNWWFDSQFLAPSNITHLKMTRDDKKLLETILELRLSESAVLSVASNTNTQKCEAFNRAVSSCLPKDINFSRNFAGRLASKTLQLNNSIVKSVSA